MTKEDLLACVKTEVKNDSLVIIQAPVKELENLSKSLREISDALAREGFYVKFIACPDHYKLLVIPKGSEVSLE